MAKKIMIQGTMSNAGKSLIVAGLCRIFKQDGYRVAPFKSQNMALNSYITEEGLEMGRAQVMQAEAAGIRPQVCMNPILLKPTNDTGSQVIVNGEVLENMKARDYFAYKKKLIPDILKAYHTLEQQADIIVIEGAGSPAEINLKENDIVNMGLAELLDAPVLLVGDIDRGGVFAQLIGTLVLLEEKEREAEENGNKNTLLRDKVTEEEIARIIERWTGIPVAKLMEGEREKLLHLEDTLHERVVGQDEAVQKVAEAILRSRAGIQSPNRPIGSFMFLGPTGVGKTELAKTLAECLFDDEKNMVRIDMTEYMEKFSVSRLIGAPPGYVGYEEGGQLTEAVRRKPYSVILFDEVEKAHPDVFNILLQVLDDGRITDSQGRTVDFKNTVIILTSNLGSNYLLEGIDANGEITQEARNQVEELLHHSFRPEFLNRLDEIVFYKPLTKDNITHIIDLIMKDLNKRLADKQLKCELTERAKDYIVETGYDPAFGARPLKRLVQRDIETLLARKIIAGDIDQGTTLVVDVENGEYSVTAK